MKVNVTLALDLPDTYRGYTPQELRQALYEEVQLHSVVSHLDLALDAASLMNGTGVITMQQAVAHHRLWAVILKAAKLTYEVGGPMKLTEKQVEEQARLIKQMANPTFAERAPAAAVAKVRARLAELEAIEHEVEAPSENRIFNEDECISHLVYTYRAAGGAMEEISLTFPFPGIDKPVFLGFYPTIEAARKTLRILDKEFYPFHSNVVDDEIPVVAPVIEEETEEEVDDEDDPHGQPLLRSLFSLSGLLKLVQKKWAKK